MNLGDLPLNITSKKNVFIELEVKFKPFPVYKSYEQYSRLLKHLQNNYTENFEESTVYNYPNDIRKIVTDTTIYERKKRLHDYKKYLDEYHFLISISEEEIMKNLNINQKPLHTRHRLRHSFIINEYYKVDLTEIVDIEPPFFEIEMEYLGDIKDLDLKILENNIKDIYNIIYQTENLTSRTQINNLIKQFNSTFKVKPQNTFNKDITVKARNIQYRDLTYGGIVGNKENEYVISHKADGKDHYLIFNNDGFWLVSSTYYNLLYDHKSKLPEGRKLTIYKCEVLNNMMVNGNMVKYYILIYDCLIYNDEDVSNLNIYERTACIEPFINRFVTPEYFNESYKNDFYFSEKPVYDLNLENFFSTIRIMYNEQSKLPYPTDGFIFTPTGKYNYHSDKLPISQRDLHSVPDVCKWKPPNQITIDFRIVNGALYVYDVKRKLEVPFEGNDRNPLTPDMIDESFKQYDNLIIEASYDVVCNKMKPLKIRDDKEGPNRLDIASANWRDIHDPITIEDLAGETLTLVNKYHNQVKNILYGLPTNYEKLDLTLPNNYTLLDIGGGKGGDLARWSKSKVSKVITVEPNVYNLAELKLRLADSDLKNKVIPIETIGEDTVQITKVVEKEVGKVDVISLMLSLSFFWGSDKNLDALVQTIVHNIKLGGIVLFFTIDNIEKYLVKDNPLVFNNAKFTLYDNKFVRAEIPGIVGKQWEFIVKFNQLTLKLRQYGIVLRDKRIAKDELLLSPESQKYSNLFTYGYYEKTKEFKVGKVHNIKLPKITYPIIVTPLTILANNQTKLLSKYTRIGTSTKNNMLDAILKAYDVEYQENLDEKLIEAFRLELSDLSDWITFNDNLFPRRLADQISGSVKYEIEDYTKLNLQYIFQYSEIPEELFSYVANFIDMDIYVFIYDEDLTLVMSTFTCEHPNRESILLLKIDNHYELLAEHTNEGLKTYFSDNLFLINIKKSLPKSAKSLPLIDYIKSVLGPSMPNLDILEINDPMYEIIKNSYVDIAIYIKSLYKTINKNYILKSDEKIANLFDSKNYTKDLKKLLEGLKTVKAKKSTERIEERITHIIDILKNHNFNSVLDIGAGKGEIITAVKEYYNLPKENVYAIDQKLPNIKTVTTLKYIENKIPLPDHSVDVILLFAVLHHIPTKERHDLMNEIARILTPNGIVIIREHDDDQDPNFYKFIDLVHQYWYIFENEQEDPLNLMSYQETINLFDSIQMHSIHHDEYSAPNPQHLYHEAFMFKFQDDFPYKSFSMNLADVDMRFKNLKSYQFNIVHIPYTIRNIPGTFYQNPELKYNNMIIKNEASDYLKYNLITDYWIDPCKMNAKRYDQDLTPIEYWHKNKDLVYKEAEKRYGKVDAYTLRESIYHLAGEVTGFRCTITVGFIKMFKSKKILDFCSGWFDRGIGAMALDSTIKYYVGVDPNSCLHPKYREMIEYFGMSTEKYIMIQSPFETAVLPPNKTYDLVITSPPYYSLEVYADETTQSITNRNLNEWFDDFLIVSLIKSWSVLDSEGHMIIIINDVYKVANYCELMVQVFTDITEDAEYLGVISYSEFDKGKPKNAQPCWVWRKK